MIMNHQSLNTVECYDPSHDTWTLVADLCVRRCDAGVGVLDGILYAVGGYDDFKVQSSVETYRPSTGVWTIIADMHLCRQNAGIYLITISKLFYETFFIQIYYCHTCTKSLIFDDG